MLVHCRECGKKISDTANSCPNCGAKQSGGSKGGGECKECGKELHFYNKAIGQKDICFDCWNKQQKNKKEGKTLTETKEKSNTKDMIYCRECGAKLTTEDKFCLSCGARQSEGSKLDENTKVGTFDIATRLQMSKLIMEWKGVCPKCSGELGLSKCKKCGEDIQKMAAVYAKKEVKSMGEVDIPGAVIKKSVRFLGGHQKVPDATEGWLAIVNKKLVFKNATGAYFEIDFKDIKEIKIVDDKYTPSLARGVVMGLLGGDTDSQSFRPHKCVLQVIYSAKTRNKELEFNFTALTWAGAVDECQKFYGKLNAMLD